MHYLKKKIKNIILWSLFIASILAMMSAGDNVVEHPLLSFFVAVVGVTYFGLFLKVNGGNGSRKNI